MNPQLRPISSSCSRSNTTHLPATYALALWVIIFGVCAGADASDPELVLIQDSFANNPIRPVGGFLDGTPVEVGRRAWKASSAVRFGKGNITNGNAEPHQIAGVPFDIMEHPDLLVFSVAMEVRFTDANWIAVGFSSSATGPYNQDGQLYMELYANGGVKIVSGGTDSNVHNGKVPDGVSMDDAVHVKVEYHRGTNSVRAWINEVELSINQSGLGNFIPQISHVGFHANLLGTSKTTSVEEGPTAYVVDGLAVGGGLPLVVAANPREWTAIEHTTSYFSCTGGGIQPPLSYRWQFRPDEYATFQDLADVAGSVSGTTSSTLVVEHADTSNHPGEYRCVITDSAIFPRTGMSNIVELRVPPAVVFDSFTNPGAPIQLAGRAAEVGGTWGASTGPEVSGGSVTNSDTYVLQLGGLEFSFGPDYGATHHRAISEAWIQPTDPEAARWIGIGFSNQPAGALWTYGQLWAFLRSDGGLHVRAGGLSHSLFDSTGAHPAFVPDSLNHLKLEYDWILNTVQVWLNQAEIALTVSDLDDFEYEPTITNVSFHAHSTGGFESPGQFFIDDFAAAVDHELLDFEIIDHPADAAVQRSYSTTFHAEATGGAVPYSYQWEFDSGGGWTSLVSNQQFATLMSGADTDTLTIVAADAALEGDYRLKVSDVLDPSVPIVSNPASLSVYYADPSCAPAEPALLDFSRANEIADWTDDDSLEIWADWGSYAIFETAFTYSTSGDYGRVLSVGDVLVPSGHHTLVVEIADIQYVGQNCQTNCDTLEIELIWGSGAGDRVAFSANAATTQVELDLGDYPSWTDGAPPNGLFARPLEISFRSREIQGYLSRIYTKPGPRLVFEGGPELYLGDLPVPQGMDLAGGSLVGIGQFVRNVGCEAEWDEAQEERRISFTLCRDDDQCFEEGFEEYCEGGHTTVSGRLDPDADRIVDWCYVAHPPAAEPPEQRTLEGRFDNDITKEPTSKTFTIVNHETPNLKAERFVPFEALQDKGGGLVYASWLDARAPFTLEFHAVSEYYEIDTVPVRVSVRARRPGEPASEEDWRVVANRNVSGLANAEVVIDGIPLEGFLNTTEGESWTLMDVRVELDPDGLIFEGGEQYESDNVAEVAEWIPVAITDVGLGHAIGNPIQGLEIEFDLNIPGESEPEFYELYSNQQPELDRISTQYKYWTDSPGDPAPAGAPLMYWEGISDEISGVMLRYKRTSNVPNDFMAVGVGSSAEDLLDAYDDLSSASGDTPIGLIGHNQWHTVVWKVDGLTPFGDLQVPPLFVDPAGSDRLGIALDSSFFVTYPYTEFDFVRVFNSGDGVEVPGDARPVALVVWNEIVGNWVELRTVMPGQAVGDVGLFVAYQGDQFQISSVGVSRKEYTTTDPSPDGVDLAVGDSTSKKLFDLDGAVFPLSNSWAPSANMTTTHFNVSLIKVLNGESTTVDATYKVYSAAESSSRIDGSLPEEEKGYQASGYDLSAHENVNLANGNLTYRIPLHTLSTDGGLSYDISLYYNSKSWAFQSLPSTEVYPDMVEGQFEARGVPNFGHGWDLRPPHFLLDHRRISHDSLLAEGITKILAWVDASGTQHEFYSREPSDSVPCTSGTSNTCPCDFSTMQYCYSWDGSNLRAERIADAGDNSFLGIVIEDGLGTRFVHEEIVEAKVLAARDLRDYAEESPGVYLSRIESGPWAGENSPANVITFEYSRKSDLESYGLNPLQLDTITASGAGGRQVRFEYDDSDLSMNGAPLSSDPILVPVLRSMTFPVFGDPVGGLIEFEISTRVVRRPGTQGDSRVFGELPHLEAVSYPATGFEYSFQYGESDQEFVDRLTEVSIPTGATINYRYGDYPVWRRRCEEDPYLHQCYDSEQTYCLTQDFPEEEAAYSLQTSGVIERKIEFDDASSTGKTETTSFRQHISCGTQDRDFPPYDLSDELHYNQVIGPLNIGNSYLWSLIETKDESDNLASVEVHRFHPLTYKEISVDHIANNHANDVSRTLANGASMLQLDETYLGPVLRHSQTTWDLKFRDLPVSFAEYPPDHMAYISETQTFTDESGANGAGDVAECFSDPENSTCAVTIASTIEVNNFLQTILRDLWSDWNGSEVNRSREFTYELGASENGGEFWLVPRQSTALVRELSGPYSGAWQAASQEWGNLGDGTSPPTVELIGTIQNPDPDSADCFEDCVETAFGYDDLGNLAAETVVRGGFSSGFNNPKVTTCTEYTNGRPTSHWLEQFAYDENTQVHSCDSDSSSRLLLWTRDVDPSTGLPLWHVNGSGAGSSYHFDELGRITDIAPVQKDGVGLIIQNNSEGKDLLGTHIEYKLPDGSSPMANEVYDASSSFSGGVLSSWIPGQNDEPRFEYQFDGLGRTTKLVERYPGCGADPASGCEEPDELIERYKVNVSFIGGSGRCSEAAEWQNDGAGAKVTRSCRDGLGRVLDVTLPDLSQIKSYYQGDSTVTTETTDAGAAEPRTSIIAVSDPLGRVRSTSEYVDSATWVDTEYSYDVADQLCEVSIDGQQKRTFTYSQGGYLTRSEEPERTTDYRWYDAFGNLMKEVTGGVGLGYVFDKWGREELRKRGNGTVLSTFTYGDTLSPPVSEYSAGYNQMVSARQYNESSQNWVEHSWEYNGPGRRVDWRNTALTNGSGTSDFGVGYTYDDRGNLAETGLGSDRCSLISRIENSYEGPWLTKVSRDGTELGSLRYAPSGRVARIDYFGGSAGGRFWYETPDESGMARPKLIGAMTDVFTWDEGPYSYDGSGNIKEIGVDKEYSYDGLSRLTSSNINTAHGIYEYDVYGNMTSIDGVPIAVNPDTNKTEMVDGQLVDDWDVHGNLEELPPIGGNPAVSLTYSVDNNQVLTAIVDGETWHYSYDVAGERVVAQHGTDTTYFIRDEAGRVLAEYDGSGSMQKQYVYTGSRLLAEVVGNAINYAILDHLGSTRILFNIYGEKVFWTEYLPFGGVLEKDGSMATDRLFTGHERDRETGLDYMHARYYSHNLGRFVSVDPVGGAVGSSQSWNRYSYAVNNPLKFVDPDGRDVMLFVRNNSGGGKTNFGHVALRVYGEGYDVTYDFGRYRGGTGLFKAKGPGILRRWTNFDAFRRGQRAKGDSKGAAITTTPEQDKAAMSFFEKKIEGGKQLRQTTSMTETQLQQDYSLLSNNCSTMSIDALESTPGLEGQAAALGGETDPREIYEDLEGMYQGDKKVKVVDFDENQE